MSAGSTASLFNSLDCRGAYGGGAGHCASEDDLDTMSGTKPRPKSWSRFERLLRAAARPAAPAAPRPAPAARGPKDESASRIDGALLLPADDAGAET
jgi:hypothetical protein